MLDDAAIKHMVERFLSWKLPENFNPDGGISFQRVFNENTPHPMKAEPSGTNLFDYGQAKTMVLHMLEGLPTQAAMRPAVTDAYRILGDQTVGVTAALSAHPCTTSPVVDHETAESECDAEFNGKMNWRKRAEAAKARITNLEQKLAKAREAIKPISERGIGQSNYSDGVRFITDKEWADKALKILGDQTIGVSARSTLEALK